MIILDSKKIVKEKIEILRSKITLLETKPRMTIIQVGDIFESNKYINIKMKVAKNIGIICRHVKLSEQVKQNELIDLVKKECQKTNGLIIQLPLPNHIDKQAILDSIDFKKDIDGLSQINNNLLYQNKECIIPATAKAIMYLLSAYNIEIKNKKIGVIGESNLVGRPAKELLIRKGAIVTSFNIETGIENSNKSDILIVAAGSPHLIKAQNIKENAVIIDVGVSKLNGSNKIYGDVDFESIKSKASAISPTIGGIGPLTVVSLLENLVELHTKNLNKNK
ncbi:MAG: bifunctional 5,10-methylenetetrahydrofolate dehydrogenase/5,10-methenyltetrahydrofolate cyclohydrolase [Metamycoplasmataceae bacterium]